jgi:FKBP12-rapamycin complex-associated protein
MLNASLREEAFDASPEAVSISVQDQVARLIAEATKPENLCQAYMGWFPFW